ncbi:hypothetical protein EAI_00303 [Harpegnathos saltator]|uniref:Uncharacterized protein n=1 Tax=Harpegnathos saltator TaxID=610380 RepID=E2B4L9_HARSA|nr:hypothetical protein EAI_00303 [Harpegnathos saltator]
MKDTPIRESETSTKPAAADEKRARNTSVYSSVLLYGNSAVGPVLADERLSAFSQVRDTPTDTWPLKPERNLRAANTAFSATPTFRTFRKAANAICIHFERGELRCYIHFQVSVVKSACGGSPCYIHFHVEGSKFGGRADAAPEDPVRAEQGRPEVVAESSSNPAEEDAAPEDPVRAKQGRPEGKMLREANPADADTVPEDPVRAKQSRSEVVAESNSNPADADAASEDPIRAKQSRLEELKRNVAGSDCKSFRIGPSAGYPHGSMCHTEQSC